MKYDEIQCLPEKSIIYSNNYINHLENNYWFLEDYIAPTNEDKKYLNENFQNIGFQKNEIYNNKNRIGIYNDSIVILNLNNIYGGRYIYFGIHEEKIYLFKKMCIDNEEIKVLLILKKKM